MTGRAARTVRLYHYTAAVHVPAILRDGYLRTTENNLAKLEPDAGPRVVWLTTEADPSAGHGLKSGLFDGLPGYLPDPELDKTRIRIAVDVPCKEAHKWRQWAVSHRSDPEWMRALAKAGGSGTWRVVERPIPVAEWGEAIDLRTGEYIIPSLSM